MRGKRFDEIRIGRDVCHQCYVRTDKSGTALARACEVCVQPNLGPAESGTTTPVLNVRVSKTKSSTTSTTPAPPPPTHLDYRSVLSTFPKPATCAHFHIAPNELKPPPDGTSLDPIPAVGQLPRHTYPIYRFRTDPQSISLDKQARYGNAVIMPLPLQIAGGMCCLQTVLRARLGVYMATSHAKSNPT